ncbi:MAG: tRNA pseudouridine(55) synthase TruB [Erysipelotrichaceae bacterium]|uniref:tRNA pseudouridine(55) synthase TruB n=1 Tax=Floccifex sp. TaxID=2815810 RepID=UPI002A74D6E4|nr:tRNA pseudouridine(55) synthase TruB [Floccifex sp.]MDD7281785.1 tRNA pseudouridine(55) synthase TruB [Erysipelotrichaceae bacterium]MDY2957534.1 tRNA pseudouridine(55) synthase TruB [Floccifex sp.]
MDGIIVVNKPTGMTSHDVVNKLRRKLNTKKIGHTGTLDPDASGVLVVLVGKACKALQFLQDTDKVYRSSIQLGYTTSTDDVFGEIKEQKQINLDFDFDSVLQSFEGKQRQKVPMTSSKKVNGKKLLEYQRQGIENIDVFNNVKIYSIHSINKDELSFEVHCSSGCYVRSICRDFGLKTNNLSCMKSLQRTQVGRFTIDMAQDLETINSENVIVYPLSMILSHIPRIDYQPIQDVYNGKHIRIDTKYDRVCIYDSNPVAIYDRDHNNVFKCVRGLF